jgi:hypothetical protein
MKRLTGSLAAVGAIAALTLAGTAGADPVTGGRSLFRPDVDTFEGFADMTISVGAIGAAEDTPKGVTFPVSGGDFDPGPDGMIEHRGGLVFSRNTADGGVVKFTQFVVKLGKRKGKVFAKSDHAAVRFMDLDFNGFITSADGTTTTIQHAKVALAKEGAEVLSDTFDFPFRKGIPMGYMTVKIKQG